MIASLACDEPACESEVLLELAMEVLIERSTREPRREEGALPTGTSTQDPRRETAGEEGVKDALRVATDMTLDTEADLYRFVQVVQQLGRTELYSKQQLSVNEMLMGKSRAQVGDKTL